jgi:hypothetical protein
MASPEKLNPDAVRIVEGKDTRKPPHVEDISAFTTDILIATEVQKTSQTREPLAAIKQSVARILGLT